MKKILGILMALTMASSFSMTTMADDVATESQIQPRAIPCDNCSNGNLWESYRYGRWWTKYTFDCEHFKYGHDEVRTRDVFVVWECSSCGYESNRIFDHEESQDLCYGRDYLTANQSEQNV